MPFYGAHAFPYSNYLTVRLIWEWEEKCLEKTGDKDRAVLTTSLMAPPPAATEDAAEPQPQTPLHRLRGVNIALLFPARSQLILSVPAVRKLSE